MAKNLAKLIPTLTKKELSWVVYALSDWESDFIEINPADYLLHSAGECLTKLRKNKLECGPITQDWVESYDSTIKKLEAYVAEQ